MEEDKNLLIIQLVQDRPTLYAKGSDFRARTLHWKEIAAILKTDVLWVKSRWHMIRSKFLEEYVAHLQGRRSTFRYFDDMSFLVEHVDINAFEKHSKRNQFMSHPEFVIEKKDLEDDSDDESTRFVELDMEEEQNKETEQIPQTFDLTEDVSQDCDDEPLLYASNNSFSTNQPSVKAGDSDSQGETIIIREDAEKEDSSTICAQGNTNNGSRQESTNEPKTSSSSLESESTAKEGDTLQGPWPKQIKYHDKNKALQENRDTEKHRCEDTIFGELVAATLRKMSSEKKKSVKREIMNILFT